MRKVIPDFTNVQLAFFFILTVGLTLAGGCSPVAAPPRNLVELQRTIQQIATASPGRVGAAVLLLGTRDEVALAGDERFPMQSVYKLPIAMTVLREVDAGHLRLDQSVDVSRAELSPLTLYSPIRQAFPGGARLTVRELIGYAVSQSDNVASDILLRLAGGPRRVTANLRRLGIDAVVVATSEREMDADPSAQYLNWATPRGVVRLLAAFDSGGGLSPASRAVLQEALVATVTGPGRIRGLLPPGTTVAHKTGTSGTVEGCTAATNDAGIVTLPDGRRLAVAVFVCDSRAGLEAREATIARIARAAYDYFASR